MTENKKSLKMSALDPYIVSNIVEPTESKKRGSDMIM